MQKLKKFIQAVVERTEVVKLKGECKALFEILIREIQDIIRDYPPEEAVKEIDKLLKSWITANKLQPELVTVKNGVYVREI